MTKMTKIAVWYNNNSYSYLGIRMFHPDTYIIVVAQSQNQLLNCPSLNRTIS